MAWFERNLKNYLVPVLLLQVGLPTTRSSTRSGCPGSHPIWTWIPPQMGHLEPLWAARARTSLPAQWKTSPTSNLNFPSLSLEPLSLVLSLPTCVKNPPAYNFPQDIRRPQWGLLRAFSSPGWTNPAPSTFIHRRGAPLHDCPHGPPLDSNALVNLFHSLSQLKVSCRIILRYLRHIAWVST